RWAGLALAGLTAIATVQDTAQIREGHTVLVHGGSGGVGQLLIPMALEAGAAQVWATGREANAERIRDLAPPRSPPTPRTGPPNSSGPPTAAAWTSSWTPTITPLSCPASIRSPRAV